VRMPNRGPRCRSKAGESGMLNRYAVLLASVLASFMLATALGGQGRGQGAVVIRDADRDGPAPI
jgi:hypothetical protein